jgi:hypothetical protein
MPDLVSFERAIELAGQQPHVLLGNGFSLAWRSDIFSYNSLFERADFKSLSPNARTAFDALSTTDFEIVMRGLIQAAALVSVYTPDADRLIQTLRTDAEGLREVLIAAIAQNHPERPGDVSPSQYEACRTFLSRFKCIYTLNYDLLLYWTIMQSEIEPSVASDDGFRTPDSGEAEYVTWEVEKTDQQNVFYLHVALHVIDAGSELQKYTWINTGRPLIEQIRDALQRGLYPLFVAEGESSEKLAKVKHSDYLSRGYRSFAKIGGSLFIYGHSLAANDDHLVRLIERNRVSQLFMSIYGDPASEANTAIIAKAMDLAARRRGRIALRVHFYNAESARVWG